METVKLSSARLETLSDRHARSAPAGGILPRAERAVRLRVEAEGDVPSGITVSLDRGQGRYVLGRHGRQDRDVDIGFADESVSRRHCELRWSRRVGWRVVDLHSTNGTLVDGVPVEDTALLEDGQVLSLGAARIRVEMTGSA